MMSKMFPIALKLTLWDNSVCHILIPNVQLKHVKQSPTTLYVQANVCGMASPVLRRNAPTSQSNNYALDPTTMRVALGYRDFVSAYLFANNTIL